MGIKNFLSGDVSPTIWLLIITSLLIGFFFFTGFIVNSTESVLYSTNILVNRHIWGAVLTAGSLVGLWGCWKSNLRAIKACGAINFLAWLFACIGMALAEHYYLLFAVYGVHLVFHLLLFAGSVTSDVFREPIYRR